MELSSPYSWRRIILSCFGVVFLLLAYAFHPCTAQLTPDPFLVSPVDTVVGRGATAVLRCALRRDVGGLVLWSHLASRTSPGVSVLFNRELQNRVSIIGRQHIGEFNMRITNVRESDSGYYECRALIGFSSIVRKSAMLTVIVPPDAGFPQCEMQPPSGLIPGQTVILTCRTQGGKPKTRLDWHRGPNPVGAQTTDINTYRHTLEPIDYGVVFECRETGGALAVQRSCTVVPLQATITVDIRPQDPVINAGETQTFGCNAKGAFEVMYSWYINGVPLVMSPLLERFVLGGGNQLLSAFDVSYVIDGTVVTCLATSNTGQVANASSVLRVLSRHGATTRYPVVTVVASTTVLPPRTLLPDPSATNKPTFPGDPERPGRPGPTDGAHEPGRPGRPTRPTRPNWPHRPGSRPGRPDHDRPDRDEPDDDSREENGDDLLKQTTDGGRGRDSLTGANPITTVTVVGAAMAGVVISIVIVAVIKIMTRVKPGTKDSLITISGSSDSEDLEPNSLSMNRNTFNSLRSTTSCEVSIHDPKRITFSDLNREYDLPPFEPDDSISYLGLRPESMTSARYTYEGLNSDTLNDSRQNARYYEISSGEYDNSLEYYEDVVSEQVSFSRDSCTRTHSNMTADHDDGQYLQTLPVPGYTSRYSINNRGRPT
ncbi:uncharacterized protein [Asterias amurensis]|uniref:uncharacterized protein n=1 Tax=Asterias amurensis TaxID=7602 RepID=UPI003AB8FC8E